MTALDELDRRLARAGSEITTTFASAPAGNARRVMRRAVRQRATMGASVAVAAVIAVGAVTLTIGGDGGERQVASRGSESSGPGTTTGGTTEVGTLDDLAALALRGGSWQLTDASERAGGGDSADAIPSRHVRYVDDAGGIVSLDLFAVPAGSFYETIVPVLTATDGFTMVSIRGVEGRVEADGNFISVAWRESSTTIASLSVHGATDQAEAVAIAESLARVDQSHWRTMMSEAPSADGPTPTTIED